MTTRMWFLPLALFAILSFRNSSPAATYDIPAGTTTNLSSTLSVADGLTKTGSGTLIVSGAANNTYTGWTSIDSGVLVAAKSGALGRITEGTIVASGASLFLSNNISIAAESLFLSGTGVGGSGALGNRGGTNRYQGPISLLDASQISSTTGTLALGTTVNAAGFALSFSNAGAAAIIAAGSIDGIGSTVTKLGTGTLVLQADNNYDGTTTIAGGAIRIADGGSLGATGLGTVVATGAALELSNNINVGTEALSLSGTGIGDAGALRNISGDNTYRGAITNVLAARINSDAGTLTLSGSINAMSQELSLGGAGSVIVSGAITNSSAGLTKAGSGTASLRGTNTYSGATTISAGVLEVTNGSAILDSAVVRLANTAGSTLLVSGSETIGSLQGGGPSGGNVSIASGQALTVAETGSQTFAGLITNSGALIKSGAGTLILSRANTFGGGVTLNAGVLFAGNNAALGRGTFSLNGGTFASDGATARVITNEISLGGNVVLGHPTGTGNLTLSNVDLAQGSRRLTNDYNVTIAGVISNGGASAGSLDKGGSGTMILSGANTYSGATTVRSGVLRLANSGALGSEEAGTLVGNNAALELSNGINVGAEALSLNGTGIGNAGALRNISGNNTYQGAISNGVTSRINSDAGTLTLSGAINASGRDLTFGGSGNILVIGSITNGRTRGIVKDGAGTTTLLASNSYGVIRIDAGTLEVASGSAIPDSVAVVFSNDSTGTLLVSKSETVGSLSSVDSGNPSAGVSIASEQTLTLAASRGSQTFAGRISGTGSLVKTNGGIQVLTGANTFAGGTFVKAGALIVNGMNSTGSGVLTVSAGATLGGFGSVSGATSIAGIHSPGASPGVQTFLSDLTYEDLASVSWELISNTSEASARGADYDGVNVDGNLTFNENVALDLSFNSAGSSVDWSDPFWSVSQNWVLYQVALSTTGAINLQLNPVDWLDANGNSFNAVRGGSGSNFSVAKSGENIVLSYNSVPEPSTYALLLMTGAGALWWARRRR